MRFHFIGDGKDDKAYRTGRDGLSLSSLTNKSLKPALVKAELTGSNYSAYDILTRHYYFANGENAKVASERLGHSTVVLTLDTYSHVLRDMQQQAAERIENLLFKTGFLTFASCREREET